MKITQPSMNIMPSSKNNATYTIGIAYKESILENRFLIEDSNSRAILPKKRQKSWNDDSQFFKLGVPYPWQNKQRELADDGWMESRTHLPTSSHLHCSTQKVHAADRASTWMVTWIEFIVHEMGSLFMILFLSWFLELCGNPSNS